MKAIFRYSFARHRGQILGWGIFMFLYGLSMSAFYPLLADQQELLQSYVEIIPREFQAFFGDIFSFGSVEGFLTIEYFSLMPLILGVFTITSGSGLLVSDEENGTLDLILAHPLSRSVFFTGRLLAFVTATVAIMVISWLGLVTPVLWTTYEMRVWALVLPMLSLMAVLLLFGGLALLFSMLLPSRRQAAMTAAILLAASFFIIGLARINPDLEPFAKLSPLWYYQTGEAMNDFNGLWFGCLVAFGALFAGLAWWAFERRDIRVGGESGWRLNLQVLMQRLGRRGPIPVEGDSSTA